jgi:hypothetical protein
LAGHIAVIEKGIGLERIESLSVRAVDVVDAVSTADAAIAADAAGAADAADAADIADAADAAGAYNCKSSRKSCFFVKALRSRYIDCDYL